jgi:hypothetical protein
LLAFDAREIFLFRDNRAEARDFVLLASSPRAFFTHLPLAAILVTLLSGGPFAPGYSSVMLVNPTTGETTSLLSGLNNATDVACVTRPVPNSRPLAGSVQPASPADPLFSLFVLEISTNLGAVPPPPGRVVRYDGLVPKVFVDGLQQPTSLALDESTGTAYIVSRSDGTILSAKYR